MSLSLQQQDMQVLPKGQLLAADNDQNTNPYHPGDKKDEITKYIKNVIDAHAGKWRQGDIDAGLSLWMLMYLISLMSGFTSESLGSNAYVDKDINNIKEMIRKINDDFNQGGNPEQQGSFQLEHVPITWNVEGYEWTTTGTITINGKYYEGVDENGKTVKYWYDVSSSYKYDNGITTIGWPDSLPDQFILDQLPSDFRKELPSKDANSLEQKMLDDIEAAKKAINNNDYFSNNETMKKQLIAKLDDIKSVLHLDDPSKANLHDFWKKFDPQRFDPNDKTPGDHTDMNRIVQDFENAEAQCRTGDNVEQAVIKSMTSLYNTETSFMTNINKALNSMINHMVSCFRTA